MNINSVVGGKESKDIEHERFHLMMLNHAQILVATEQAPKSIRLEALSVLLGAYSERGEA